MNFSRRLLQLLNIAALIAILVAVYVALIQAPDALNVDPAIRPAQRIIYFHVPSAWSSMLAFFVAFVASILYLITTHIRWDIWARSASELGIAFTVAAIISGSLWAKPAWNTYWTWDPRLTTYTIVLLLYIAYFMLRGAIDEPGRRARMAAVYGIFSFLSVPLTFMSIRWWNTIHPVIVEQPEGAGKFGLGPNMLTAFMITNLAFILVFAALLANRIALGWLEERTDALKEQLNF
ncbi:MAG: cytochrome C assembly protein [Clostridia bacterium]|nr:MAG: cytochrome C assembly protein [Clostridia bacterium]